MGLQFWAGPVSEPGWSPSAWAAAAWTWESPRETASGPSPGLWKSCSQMLQVPMERLTSVGTINSYFQISVHLIICYQENSTCLRLPDPGLGLVEEICGCDAQHRYCVFYVGFPMRLQSGFLWAISRLFSVCWWALMLMRLSESNFHRQFLCMPALRVMTWNYEKGLQVQAVCSPRLGRCNPHSLATLTHTHAHEHGHSTSPSWELTSCSWLFYITIFKLSPLVRKE